MTGGVCLSRTRQIRRGIGLWVRVSRTFVRFRKSDSDFCPTRTFRNRIRVESDFLGAGRRSDLVGLCPIPKVRLGLLSDSDPPESDPSGIGPCRRRKALGPSRTLSDSESPTRTRSPTRTLGIGSEWNRTLRRANGARSDIWVRVGLCCVRLRQTPPCFPKLFMV